MRLQVRSGIKSVLNIWQDGFKRLHQQIRKYNATLSVHVKEIEAVHEAAEALDDLVDNKEEFYKPIIRNEHKDYIEDEDDVE